MRFLLVLLLAGGLVPGLTWAADEQAEAPKSVSQPDDLVPFLQESNPLPVDRISLPVDQRTNASPLTPALPISEDTPRPAVEPPPRGAEPQQPFVSPNTQGPLNLHCSPYRYPDQLLQGPWLDIKHALTGDSLRQIEGSLNRLYEAGLDAGFPNSPDYALLLLRQASRLAKAGDVVRARIIGETAHNLAPDFYPVPVLMSRLALADPEKNLLSYLYLQMSSWKERLRSFAWQRRVAGRCLVIGLAALYLFFQILGVHFLFRYGKILLHSLEERAPGGSWGTYQVMGLLLSGTFACLLLPGVFWLTVCLGMFFSRFAQKWEKLVFAFCLLLWAGSPVLFPLVGRFLIRPTPPVQALTACIEGDWDARAEQSLAGALQQSPDSADLLLAKAVVEKRRCEFRQAEETLSRMIQRFPADAPAWNNLGNLYGIQGQASRARDAYAKAIDQDRELASPHYNLSLLLRRDFAFLEGAREFEQARRLDPKRVDYFAYIHSQNANRFFMDIDPPRRACWRYFFKNNPEAEDAAHRLWDLAGTGIPLAWAPWVFGPLIGIVLLWMGQAGNRKPFRCSGCGVIACGRCQPGTRFVGMCNPCYQTLYQRSQIVRERRNLQVRKMALSQARRSRRLLLVNLLLPGVGYSVAEERASGMLFFLVFLFGVLTLALWSRLPLFALPGEDAGQEIAGYILGAALALGYAGLQVLTAKRLRLKG